LPYEKTAEYFPGLEEKWKKMNPWFSSLWTLQEICIGPHMWICDKDWQLLTATPSKHVKVELDALIVIGSQRFSAPPESFSTVEEAMRTIQASSESECLALKSLAVLIESTGLSQLQNAHRSTILALGSRRQCRDRRAEAIMSAVGITEWYNKQFDSKAAAISSPSLMPSLSEHRTPVDDYPEAFVREAAQKIGAVFYASSPGDDEVLWWLSQGDSTTLSASQGLGSMFPFPRYPSQHEYDVALELESTFDHPTVDEWIVCGHSVRASKAAILSYTGQRDRSGTRDQPLQNPWIDFS
jgi:hypothetical protein